MRYILFLLSILFCAYRPLPPLYFPANCHTLASISALGDSLEIEDGSVWKIHSKDSDRIFHWSSTDPLKITQNTGWFSNYSYRIVNQNRGEAIEVNLFLGPLEEGSYTRRIAGIDITRGELFLSDNSHWEICDWDEGRFHKWAVGDAIILGENSSWQWGYNAILINVNVNSFVRAKQF